MRWPWLVRHGQVVAIRRQVHGVGMRLLLPLRVDAAALVGDGGQPLCQVAERQERRIVGTCCNTLHGQLPGADIQLGVVDALAAGIAGWCRYGPCRVPGKVRMAGPPLRDARSYGTCSAGISRAVHDHGRCHLSTNRQGWYPAYVHRALRDGQVIAALQVRPEPSAVAE